MFLKRRNYIAWALILLAAFCWSLGQFLLQSAEENETTATTVYVTAATEFTVHPTMERYPDKTVTAESTEPGAEPVDTGRSGNRGIKWLGIVLCFLAVAGAVTGVAVLYPREPGTGPDGICLLMAVWGAASYFLQNMDYILWGRTFHILTVLFRMITGAVFLVAVRELLGWALAKCSLSWCLVHRVAKRCAAPQLAMLTFLGWSLLSMTGFLFCLFRFLRESFLPALCFAAAGVLGICCLWKYGADLAHFKKQLDNYQHGKPITVGNGAFSQTEAQLLDVQAQHEEAVRTAVTSERFKVELISNVSHDLRTPLTSILGYSELLQKETLSQEGREQLHRLHQKAGYMNDLVESLFELTKVSSGVVESKKEEIDLIRLLEQTIGLFDDQLTRAGLCVRRSYASDSALAVTDGARMHQVFANLLGNAIKYALTGTRIYLEVRETESSYLIRMMNTASYEMDFKPDEILQRFARGDKARSTKGSGLGLAIAQTYTESVDGTFRICVDGDQFSAIVELPKLLRNL